jgi:hypothetical protein
MAVYLAKGIEDGRLDYTAVTTRYPQYKSDIDRILVADGKESLIVE